MNMSGRNYPNRAQRVRTTRNQDTQANHGNKIGHGIIRKSLSDHVYNIGSRKQANDYVTVTKYLINVIRKTNTYGEDIGKALEMGKEID